MNPTMNFKNLPQFTPDKPKLLAAILFLIEEAAKSGAKLSKFQIVKSLFRADDAHFAQFGRPVTFDNYGAMTHGPVGDTASDLLNDYKIKWPEFGVAASPLTCEVIGNYPYYSANVAADRDELSPSDVEALMVAMAEVRRLSFTDLSDATHKHPAYGAAWNSGADAEVSVVPMDWRLFPSANAARVSDLVFASRFPS